MDLVARTNDLADALAVGQGEDFLAARFEADVLGRRFTREQVVGFLQVAPRIRPVIGVATARRNLVFCDGEVPGLGAGMAVLSWDQDGLLTSVTVQRR